MVQQVLIGGSWRESRHAITFQAENPQAGQPLPEVYPVSTWEDCEAAVAAAVSAFEDMLTLPADAFADFLESYAARIERRKDEFSELANLETGLPVAPRLRDVELPRTTGQLRQAASAARDGSWSAATIDTTANIRSYLAPIGPVVVFGPNNFPFAFGSASGGDFAAAIAAGNPVIAKANSSHPGTTRLFAEEALAAAQENQVPEGIVQMIYRTSHSDGERLVAEPRIGATGYTGSRRAGLRLKTAADLAGAPIYLELSSINPVLILPGALAERFEPTVEAFCNSCLLGTGQFCTNPGLVLLLRSELGDRFVATVAEKFDAAPVGPLLSRAVQQSLRASIDAIQQAGAELVVGGEPCEREGYAMSNTLLRTSGARFVAEPGNFQREAFGNASLCVVADDLDQMAAILGKLEGNLTGCIYSGSGAEDGDAYQQLAPVLRQKVGRLLNDKMPTGVAVTPAMNHGGPYPATGHPGFTAVGIPTSMRRFAMLQCFDGVRPDRLPTALRNQNPNGAMWRLVDGCWTREDISE